MEAGIHHSGVPVTAPPYGTSSTTPTMVASDSTLSVPCSVAAWLPPHGCSGRRGRGDTRPPIVMRRTPARQHLDDNVRKNPGVTEFSKIGDRQFRDGHDLPMNSWRLLGGAMA